MNPRHLLALLLLGTLGACSFKPGAVDTDTLREQAQIQRHQDLDVRTHVISDKEARDLFGVGLGSHGIQAVWLEIDNRTTDTLYYLPVTTDQQYFSPLEVAWKVKGKFNDAGERAVDEMFFTRAMPVTLPPGERTSGFVFTNRDLGVKVVNVDVLGGGRSWQTSFLLDVPGIKLDVEKVDLSALYEKHEYRELDREGLRTWLAEQTCCTANAENDKTGDPVNFTLVGDSLGATTQIWAGPWRRGSTG